MENMNNQETQVQIQVVEVSSKKQGAMLIFKEMNGMAKGQDGKFLTSRKSIIERLMKELNMTKDGAATYIANFRRGYWDNDGKVNKAKVSVKKQENPVDQSGVNSILINLS